MYLLILEIISYLICLMINTIMRSDYVQKNYTDGKTKLL